MRGQVLSINRAHEIVERMLALTNDDYFCREFKAFIEMGPMFSIGGDGKIEATPLLEEFIAPYEK